MFQGCDLKSRVKSESKVFETQNINFENCDQNIDNEGAKRPHYQYFARVSEGEPKANLWISSAIVHTYWTVYISECQFTRCQCPNYVNLYILDSW